MCGCRLSILLLLTCSGCGGVFSVQPLSDDSNSVLDERLFGQWQGEDADDKLCTLTIHRKPGTKATLEIVSECADDEPRGRRVERTIAFVLREHYDWLSIQSEAKGDQRPMVYGVARYQFHSPDRLGVFLLDPKVLGRAVERGTLRGEVSYSKVEPEPAEPDGEPADEPRAQPEPVEKSIQNVVLSDSPQRILEFIRRNGDKSFQAEPVVLRRVKPPAARPDAAREDAGRDSASALIPAGAVFVLIAALLFVAAVFIRSFRQHAVPR